MSGFRTPGHPRGQSVLWAYRLEDAIPQDHPVRLLDYLLHSEAFADTFTAWAGEYVLIGGKPPYHPRDLSGLYLYGMMNRIRSSRQLESACHNRLDVIWLMPGQKPDHSTIASFVRQHGKHLGKLFRNVLGVAGRAGLVGFDHLTVDGTKIEADAGKSSVRDEQKIASSLSRRDEKKEGRSKPNYNGQAAVDDVHGVIAAAEVNDQPNDSGQLTPLVEQSIENCGPKPQAVSADRQYNTGPELASMEKKGVISYYLLKSRPLAVDRKRFDRSVA